MATEVLMESTLNEEFSTSSANEESNGFSIDDKTNGPSIQIKEEIPGPSKNEVLNWPSKNEDINGSSINEENISIVFPETEESSKEEDKELVEEDAEVVQLLNLNYYKPSYANEVVPSRPISDKRLHEIADDELPETNRCGFITRLFFRDETAKRSRSGTELFGCIGILIIPQLFPILIIIVGALHLDKKSCTAEDIPLLLVIGGCIALIQGLLATAIESAEPKSIERLMRFKTSLLDPEAALRLQDSFLKGKIQAKDAKGTEDDDSSVGHTSLVVMKRSSLIIGYASFACLIHTSVVVYRLFPHVRYDKGAPADNYCQMVPYWFAFVIVTATLMGLGILSFALIFGPFCTIAELIKRLSNKL